MGGAAPAERDFVARLRADLGEEVEPWLGTLGPDDAFVGGWVRDVLLGRESSDVDLVSPDSAALAERIRAAQGRRTVVLDPVRGTHRVILRGGAFIDVATLQGPDLEHDLRRRDFTIGALAWSPRRGLVDPTGGLDDLRRGRIRVCGPDSFADDPVRALRAARFQATLRFEIDPATWEAMTHVDLGRVAAERTRAEISRILAAPDPRDALDTLARTHLLSQVLPGGPDPSRWLGAQLRTVRGPAIRRCIQAAEHHAPGAAALGLLLGTGETSSFVALQEELKRRRHSERVARCAARLATSMAGAPLPVDTAHDRAFLLGTWRCDTAWVLLGLAARGASLDDFEPRAASFLVALDSAAGARNPKGLAVPPVPRPLLDAADLRAQGLGGPDLTLVFDELVVAQLDGTVTQRNDAERWLARRMGPGIQAGAG